MKLFFVRADGAEGANMDLLVRAEKAEDCPGFWRKYFAGWDLDDDAKPMWVGAIPGVVVPDDAVPGAIGWGEVNRV